MLPQLCLQYDVQLLEHHELQVNNTLQAQFTAAMDVQLQLVQVPFLTYSLPCPFAKDAVV